MIMIYDLFDDDPSFELVGVLRGTRCVCVTIQDCVMSTGKLKTNCSSSSSNANNISNEHPDGPSTMEGLDEELMVAPL